MRKKLIVITFLMILFGFSITHILLPDQKISISERREYKTLPKFTLDSKYINNLEQYLLDHFPLRDTFRSIKAHYNLNLLQMLDNNKIYVKDKQIFKLNYPLNMQSVDYFKQHIQTLKANFSDDNQVYFMLIPDKNYYVEDSNFLKIDYEFIQKQLVFDDVKEIAIFDLLSLDDYYDSDSHWRQNHLDKIVKRMDEVMKFNYQSMDFMQNTFDDFYGVYYGESALNLNSDTIIYLTNSILNQCEVTYLENKTLSSLYNEDNLTSMDAYEVFLDGASSFITIENKQALTNKELIVFRDSFGSSLVPLLAPYYQKISVVDLRYITLEMVNEMIDYQNQDILMMYNVALVNESFSLKK